VELGTGNILFNFNHSVEPLSSAGSLVADKHGNLYGTTASGGAYDQGQVFELSPPTTPGSPWTETVLYSFGAYAADGIGSGGAVVTDAAGNLYGTTIAGGAYSEGTVWELSPPTASGEPWTETILHNFAGDPDGAVAYTGLVFDKSGNLYGVTYGGGTEPCSCGTVFELSPLGGGVWSETVLHAFEGSDGRLPFGGLLINSYGEIYGTTQAGGNFNNGIAFELRP
jgi:uncharacterized repeat protein (TIGR03803 family)